MYYRDYSVKKYEKGGKITKGTKLDVGVYRVGKPTLVYPSNSGKAKLYEQKIVEIFENGDIATASDYGRKLGDFKSQKYPIISKEQLEAQYKMADGGMMAKGSLPYSTKNGINFYINRDGTTANVIANIEDDDVYMLDKSDLREMSLSAKIMGIDKVILHTNYGLELRSNEKPKIVGFDKIIKTQSDMAKGGMMADGGMMAKGGLTSNIYYEIRDENDRLVKSYLSSDELIKWAKEYSKELNENVKIENVKQAIKYIEKYQQNPKYKYFEIYTRDNSGMMAKGGEITNSGISADIGRMYKGDRKKIKFIYVIHKRDEYDDIIPKPVKKMSVVRVNEETAKEVVYKKYPSRNYFVELEDAFYVK